MQSESRGKRGDICKFAQPRTRLLTHQKGPTMEAISKGQVITFKPEWRDPDDENIMHVAVDDESKGRVKVVALLGMAINPTQVVFVDMIESARDAQ
jgi:hypothetical protein